MTNTRIMDAEVFERPYPVLLREFSSRAGSGGKGRHRGGEGVFRDIEFRILVHVSILSEHRVYQPYGLDGGKDTRCRQSIWVRKILKKNDRGESWEERHINLGDKSTTKMQPGKHIIVITPGGGGWGKIGDESIAHKEQDPRHAWPGGSLANRMATQETNVQSA
ncbi:hypothetical protein VTN02DRAFT_6188 [Thermoascus thermophilus]